MYNLELRSRKNPVSYNSWEKELDRFFDVFSKQDYFAPACEILDEEKSYSISLDIPGMKEQDIEIEVKDNHLHITGERKSQTKAEKDNVLRTERRYGKFSRVFSLPQNVNSEGIEAHFQDGVLEVVLPKEERSQSKKITISHGKKESTAELKN